LTPTVRRHQHHAGLLEDLEGGKTYVPEFNSVVAFNVPRDHVVTPVTGNRFVRAHTISLSHAVSRLARRDRTHARTHASRTHRPRYSIFGWMLRKGRLYELPIDEDVPPADADAKEEADGDSNVPQDDKGKGKDKHEAAPAPGWSGKRDRQLFEWMMGGGMTADDFFDKYWEQEPLLIQRRQDKGAPVSLLLAHTRRDADLIRMPHACRRLDYYAGLISKDDLTRDLLERFDIQFTRNLDITSYQGTTGRIACWRVHSLWPCSSATTFSDSPALACLLTEQMARGRRTTRSVAPTPKPYSGSSRYTCCGRDGVMVVRRLLTTMCRRAARCACSIRPPTAMAFGRSSRVSRYSRLPSFISPLREPSTLTLDMLRVVCVSCARNARSSLGTEWAPTST
jgi:hypothetical protein